MYYNNVKFFAWALRNIMREQQPTENDFHRKVLQAGQEHDLTPIGEDRSLFKNNNARSSKKYPYIILSKCMLYISP